MKMIPHFTYLRTLTVLFLVYSAACYPRVGDDADIKQKSADENENSNKLGFADVLPKTDKNSKLVNEERKLKHRREDDKTVIDYTENSKNKANEATNKISNVEISGFKASEQLNNIVDTSNKRHNSTHNNNVSVPNKRGDKNFKKIARISQETQEGDLVTEIIIPDDTDSMPDDNNGNSPSNNENNEKNVNSGDITGNINIDSNGIEGSIELPDDWGSNGDNSNSNKVNSNGNNENINISDNQGKESKGSDNGGITGVININSDGIDGSLDLPDDIIGVNSDSNNKNSNGDDNNSGNGSLGVESSEPIQGNINSGDGISGNITINTSGDISGSIIIHDSAMDPGDLTKPEPISSGENTDPGESKPKPISSGESSDPGELPKPGGDSKPPKDRKPSADPSHDGKSCWMNLDSKKYLKGLDELDAKYKNARQEYQQEIGPAFDKKMMEVLLESQGKAPRAVHQAQGDPSIIPAGLNLGGFGMMRMAGSILFFHRLKLRNDTSFRVNFLQANLMDMSLMARLSLHDLHLQGAYERTTTESRLNVLYFVPNYGELHVLLKDVAYKMEGRLRMLNNRLMIELINSNVLATDVLLTYANSSSATKILAQDNIEDFVDRLKSDLDLWLKDYFNDYLMYFGIIGGKSSEIQVYEKQKTIQVNEYADYAIKAVKKRIRDMGFENVKIPHLTIITATLQQVNLKSGILRGLDSIYRRSVATTRKEDNMRKVDFIIGFSNLKVEYQYEAVMGPDQQVLTGVLVLCADELTAHFELTQFDGSQSISINIDTILQLKSESLTVEGPASRLIANFKFILENTIIAIMTNVMKHNIKMLKTLPGCDPRLWGEQQHKSFFTPYKPRDNNGEDEKKPQIPKEVSKSATEAPEPPIVELPEVPSDDPPFNPPDNPDRENTFVKPEIDWEDYVFSKNDSVEIETPINGKVQKMKLERNENFVLSKVP